MYELALCNEWDWFLTITLDPGKYDEKIFLNLGRIFHGLYESMEKGKD